MIATSWRRFTATLILFVLPLAAGLAGLELWLARVPNAYAYKRQLVETHKDTVEAIVLGSSHEFAGVNTDLFPVTTLNLALPSQSLSQSAGLMLKYLPPPRQEGRPMGVHLTLPKLRHVLLGVSYYSLPYRMSRSGDARLAFYIRTFGVLADTTPRDRLMPANYLYSGIYGWGAVQSLLRDPASIDYLGPLSPTGVDAARARPLPPDAPPTIFKEGAVLRAATHYGLASEGSAAVNLAWLSRLAEQCRTAGAALHLFTSPVTTDYVDAFGPSIWEPHRLSIEQFARETGVSYVDYSQHPLFTWRDFRDADHLNPAGAAKFSDLLARSAGL